MGHLARAWGAEL